MYDVTITLFNRYQSRSLGDTWYPTVIENVDVVEDRASIVASQGTDTSDSAKVHVKYTNADGHISVAGKTYLDPLEWAKVLTDELDQYVTFKSGNAFDFILVGAYEDLSPISDEDYTEGFYNYMNAHNDRVYAISSVSSPYKLIPHFEIMAR